MLIPPKNMKAIIAYSTAGFWKLATLALRLEKPPVPKTENVWHSASKLPIPAQRRAMYEASESPKYTFHSADAVSVIRGFNFSEIAPENSAR